MFEKLFRKKEVKNSENIWPFSSPENEVTVTVKQIVDKTLPILLVAHEEEDGSWQFLCDTTYDVADLKVVALEEIVKRDPTVNELFQLNYGWHALRETVEEKWQTEEHTVEDESEDAEETEN